MDKLQRAEGEVTQTQAVCVSVAKGNKRGRQGVLFFFISFSPPPVLGRTGLDNKAKPMQWPGPCATLQGHAQLLHRPGELQTAPDELCRDGNYHKHLN